MHRIGSRGIGLLLTCTCAAVVVGALVGPNVLLHPGTGVVGRNPAFDFQIMTWSLAWWPWAVAHGADPLYTHLLWAPGGFSSLWVTSIPLPALLALPLTVTAGPLVAYNVMMLMAVVLAAAAAYLLSYELTGRSGASIAGGLVYGLSPYMLGHTLSQHLDLTFVFPLPLLVLLGVRFVRGRTSARRFVTGFAVLLLVQLGSSFELFLDLTLMIAVVGVIALLAVRRQRSTFLRLAGLIALAYAVCLPVLLAIAVVGLSRAHGAVGHVPSDYAVDLLNVVVPTPVLLTGSLGLLRGLTRHFVGNIGEQDGYLGLPLLVVAVGALRAEWRRGAWLAGLVLVAAVLLSLGPTLTVGGHPIVGLPFAFARMPVLGSALPARMSVFAALAVSCLTALWFARPRSRSLQIAGGVIVCASLLPNFWPPSMLPGAWARSTAFAWSMSRAPSDVLSHVRGASVLVLPTGDRTAAAYWQTQSGMRFSLAVPATPFVPPAIAGEPTVARLVDNVLPQLDGSALGAARLRAFLLDHRVAAVVATRFAGRRWRQLARKATGVEPIALEGSLRYVVPRTLAPLEAAGELRVKHGLRAWLQFGGTRARLFVTTQGRTTTVSAPTGDAEGVSTAVGPRGRDVVAFTEWHPSELLLRVATHSAAGWRVATLERSTNPIWSQRVVFTPAGATIAVWIDETGPLRRLRAAVRPAGGRWQPATTLETADGLGSFALASGASTVLAWHDSLASEQRVRATAYANGSWRPAVTLESGFSLPTHLAISHDERSVVWRLVGARGHSASVQAARLRTAS